MFVKICGLTDSDGVEAAVAAGADAVGFVFAPSVRELTPRRAAELAAHVPRGVIRVAVMRHPAPAAVDEVLRDFSPDWLQTDAEDFASLDLPPGCAALPVYREGRAAAADYPARLLFEGATSGSGTTADWDEAERIARRSQLILAGGLDAGNVAAAVERVRPWGVDTSSGVESSRGRKDPDKIRRFVALIRSLEN
jgi:phosphoribosylanthranilate isomerase